MPDKRYQLEQPKTKSAESQAEWGSMQRIMDRVGQDVTAASAYSPSVPADWSGNPPSTVQDALDRIAAALGPIA